MVVEEVSAVNVYVTCVHAPVVTVGAPEPVIPAAVNCTGGVADTDHAWALIVYTCPGWVATVNPTVPACAAKPLFHVTSSDFVPDTARVDDCAMVAPDAAQDAVDTSKLGLGHRLVRV